MLINPHSHTGTNTMAHIHIIMTQIEYLKAIFSLQCSCFHFYELIFLIVVVGRLSLSVSCDLNLLVIFPPKFMWHRKGGSIITTQF